MENKSLRFAPLIRVSSEQQERRGESLNVQKQLIKTFVNQLNGTLINDPWKYSGQEHSTPGFERKKLDELLGDSGKGLFDAVLVTDYDRWSRNNLKNKQALAILRSNKIKFFAGTSEHDLYNPEDCFKLGISTEIAEYVIAKQVKKSLQSRISLAKKGHLASGSRPVGRLYDVKTKTWEIDEAARQKYETIAKEFLAGSSIPKLAKAHGMNRRRLQDNLYFNMGTKWLQKIDGTKYGIGVHEVETSIPALLPDEIIQAVQDKIGANKTVFHGQTLNQYLLGRMLICGHCGRSLYGQTQHQKFRYYSHPKHCDCRNFTYINADLLDSVIVPHVFELIGNAPAMEQAALAALPKTEDNDKLKVKIAEHKKEISTISLKKNRLMDAIEKGAISMNDVELRMKNHGVREAYLTSEISKAAQQIENIETTSTTIKKAKLALRQLRESMTTWRHFNLMTWGDKRAMLQMLFTGKGGHDGKRLGVYLEKTKNPETPWYYKIKGIIGNQPVLDVDRIPSNNYKQDADYKITAAPLSACWSEAEIPLPGQMNASGA